jgi:nucleoside-diphosphate-sugar epimerase
MIVKANNTQGHEVLAVGKRHKPPPGLQNYATYLRADIRKEYSLPSADLIIHAAALSDDKAKMHTLFAPNVNGVLNTLKASEGCPKFIFISSSSIYLPEENLITENLAGNQNNKLLSDYGKSKLLGEGVVNNRYEGESCYILRARAFYGPGDTQILPRMLKLVKKGVFNKPGAMDNSLSMTHYSNMAHGIECCINSELKGIRTYNIADDQTYIMVEMLRKIFSISYKEKLPEKEIKIELLKVLALFRIGGFTPLLVRALTKNMVLDISKIKNELRYAPKINLDNSVDELGKWIETIGGPEVLKNPESDLSWRAFQ